LEAPKTEKGRRALPLLPRTVDALRWHRMRQDAEKITAGGTYTDHGFVFASPTGEPLQGTVVFKYDWLPTLRRLTEELLGHASMAITADVYSHTLPAYRREAADVLAAHLEKAR
jgi:integrase